MKNIVILGAGDLGKEIVWLIEDINKREPQYLILGFLDDDLQKMGDSFFGYKVLGTSKDLDLIASKMPVYAIIAIQDGMVRKKIVEEHPTFDNWETIIHPSAVVASTSKIGKGSILFPQVTISVDNNLGKFGLYYIHATVCNDCLVGDYTSVMSGSSISEHVKVGMGCFLAAGSTIYPHIQIGNNVNIGVEATASKNYGDGVKVDEPRNGFLLFK